MHRGALMCACWRRMSPDADQDCMPIPGSESKMRAKEEGEMVMDCKRFNPIKCTEEGDREMMDFTLSGTSG